MLCVLSVGCASQEAPAKPEAPASAMPAAADVDAKTKTETKAERRDDDSPWHWRSDAEPSRSPTYLLGVMGQSGIEHCPGGSYDPKWLSVRPTIGRISVSGPDDEVLDPLMDQPVLALGQPGEPPPADPITTTIEPCPPAQMRSDWRMTPRGMLIERSPEPSLPHLRMHAVRALHELRARKDGDHVVVTLTNPVPVALTGVVLRTHYEGCFGKPGHRSEDTAVGDLGVGAQASARVPLLSNSPGAPEGRHEFRAYSVQLEGRGEGVVIDLDVRFAQLGVEIECPNE